jgi:hypothetical protein
MVVGCVYVVMLLGGIGTYDVVGGMKEMYPGVLGEEGNVVGLAGVGVGGEASGGIKGSARGLAGVGVRVRVSLQERERQSRRKTACRPG